MAPFTDYGFYKLFEEKPNKDLLLDFLNELLKAEQGQIKDLIYLKPEHLGIRADHRRAVFDICCENEKGEKFIVELQKSKHDFSKDSTAYYATFPIVKQTKRAGWNVELNAVYVIAVLDFVFKADKKEPEKYRYDVQLQDTETGKAFYDRLTFIYLEMPKFNKTIDQMETRLDKWLYVLRNLNHLDGIPDKLREPIFDKLFETAEIGRFTLQQVHYYEDSLKVYRDLKNSLDTARREGREEGRTAGFQESIENGLKEGKSFQVVRNFLLANRFTVTEIATFASVSEDFVEKVRKALD